MAGNKGSETEIRLRGFAWDFLWSSATSHTATFLSWGCCSLTVRGKDVMKIWKGQKISDSWVELAPVMMPLWSDMPKRTPARWNLVHGRQTQKPFMCQRAQIISVHAKVSIFCKFISVTKLLYWPDLFALAWKGRKRKASVFFLPLVSMQHACRFRDISFPWFSAMHGNECGARVSVTSHKTKQPEGSCSPAIQQVAPLSGKQQRMGSIHSQEVPVWPLWSFTPCLLHGSHLGQFWWCSPRAARFGADFLFQHPRLFLPSKQGVGLLAALPASISCPSAMSPALLFSSLLFSAADTLTPSQKFQHWDLLVPGICSWALFPHVSACAAAALGISQLNWSLLCVRRQGLHAVFSIWHSLNIFLSSSLAAF